MRKYKNKSMMLQPDIGCLKIEWRQSIAVTHWPQFYPQASTLWETEA